MAGSAVVHAEPRSGDVRGLCDNSNKLSASLYFYHFFPGFLLLLLSCCYHRIHFFFRSPLDRKKKPPYMPFFMSQSKQPLYLLLSYAVRDNIHSFAVQSRLRRHLETRRAQTVSAPLGNLDQQSAFLVRCDRRSKFIKRSFRT